MEKAAELQYGKLPQLQKQLAEEEEKVKARELTLVHESVTDEEIAKIISRWTGIPVAKLNEKKEIKRFIWKRNFGKRVIGQDEGVIKGQRQLSVQKQVSKTRVKPIGSFRF